MHTSSYVIAAAAAAADAASNLTRAMCICSTVRWQHHDPLLPSPVNLSSLLINQLLLRPHAEHSRQRV